MSAVEDELRKVDLIRERTRLGYEQARQLRTRLDTAAAVDEATRSYVERLEAMADEARLPSGEDLINEIERFLRERGNGGPSSGPSR